MDFKQKLIEENTVELVDSTSVIKKIQKGFDKLKVKVEAVLGGSVAKGTFLKNYDMDIFVRFYNNPSSDMLERVLKKEFKKVDRLHGSRDYFQIVHAGKRYEVVPVLKIKKSEQAENVTDVSMLHVAWVNKHLKNPGEVKLAKLFCKAQKVYGAESYINGFSGYLLEILVVNYGSFDKLINAAAKWKPRLVIDAAKHYKNHDEVFKSLNASKLVSPIIVIDPVQKSRNAAAAVNAETFNKLVESAKRYARRPSIRFFIKKRFSLEELRKKAKNAEIVALKVEPVKGKEDVVYTKLLKAYEFLKANIEKKDFNIIKSEFEVDESIFWFIVNPKELPAQMTVVGPKKDVRPEFIRDFKKKYKKIKLEKGRYTAVAKRKYLTPMQLVKDLIRHEYFKERVRRVCIC
jgi:tRNA nucleotidyltransferase (CCA-adding enzyme)